MADKSKIGDAQCPLVAGHVAELWGDKNGKPYLKCEHCVSMVRSQSRAGWDAMRSRLIAAAPAPKPDDAKPDEKKPDAKRKPAPDPKPAPAAPAAPERKRTFF